MRSIIHEHRYAFGIVLAAAAPFSFQTWARAQEKAAEVNLTILATTDIHGALLDYDYLKDAPAERFGLVKAATIIKELRAKNPEAVLVDNGDLIQGNPLAELHADRFLTEQDGMKGKAGKGDPSTNPIVAAVNAMRYDVANIGNHEFNFGLQFLEHTLKGAAFPFVTANVFKADGKQAWLPPFHIVERTLQGRRVRVGFFGLTPTQIMVWDKEKLAGHLSVRDPLVTARAIVPRMRAEGADVVVALAHGGIEYEPYDESTESPVYHLAKIDGIDAVVAGHAHGLFPSPEGGKGAPADVNVDKGTMAGKPVVMPGSNASHVGVLTLRLRWKGKSWLVASGTGALVPVAGGRPEPELVRLVAPAHEATLAFIRKPVGSFTGRVHSYFARVADSPALQIVNDAQMAYVREKIRGTTLEKIPVLSAVAPFRSGFHGGSDFTDIPAGPVTYKEINDLYLYPNTLCVVKLNGEQVRRWLEKSAEAFNHVPENAAGDIPLLAEKFPAFNFDVIDGVNYRIDVGMPVGKRIVSLTHQGRPVTVADTFLVATNNYRADGGGDFPALDGSTIVLREAEENRQTVLDYVRAHKNLEIRPDENWKLVVPPTKGRVLFSSAAKARELAPAWLAAEDKNGEGGMARFVLSRH